MSVLVDTGVWSLALRKKTPDASDTKIIEQLKELLLENQAVIIGPVRQELLSGLPESPYERLKQNLSALEDCQISAADYELAAAYFNICRKNGVQGSHTDFLLCAVANSNNFRIFTLDKDFEHYSRYIPLSMYKVER